VRLVTTGRRPTGSHPHASAPRPPHRPATPAPTPQERAVEPAPDPIGTSLARLGLPPELEPAGDDLRRSLLDQLARLPRPPALPTTRGTVVAVIGSRAAADEVARRLCSRIGADPVTIATLTTRRRRASDAELTTPAEVTDHRRSWRRRPLPTVAVVDAPPGRPSCWASDVLAALEPTVVWGVVEASRKVEDIAAWSEDLGGLDALCVNGLDDTVTPAAPLRAGLPVALIDGHPATPERWADVLLTHLKESQCLVTSARR
jgi:hypothetical protein